MRVAVVGAGVAGLAAARALRQSGADVVIFEQGDRVGGVLRSRADDGYVHEHAANGFLGSDEGGAIELAHELGVVIEEASPAARRRWIYLDGALRALPANPFELVTTDLLSWRGKLSALAEPLRPARRVADESVAAFARRRLGPEIAHAVVGPFVTGVFAARADELSLRAAFPQIAALEDRGGLVRGGIARLLENCKDRAGGERARLSAPIGGVEVLVEAIADELRPSLRLSTAVASISRVGDAVAVALAGAGTERFDRAVLASPAHASAALVADAAPQLAAVLRSIPYAPIAIVYLGYERSRIDHPLDGFGFLVAEGEPLRMLGTVFESVLWSRRAPEGRVLLRCIFGGGRDPEAMALDDESLITLAQRELGPLLGIEGEAEHTAVVRWQRGIAQYTLGHLDRVARAEELARPLGLVLAGSAYHGVAVNKLIADAGRVVREVLGAAQKAAGILVLFAAITALIACGGKNKRSAAGDGDGGDDAAAVHDAGPTTPEGAAPSYRLAPTDTEGKVAGAGTLDVSVQWVSPPATLRRSPGRTACGTRVPEPVSVHTMHGVRNAVVSLVDINQGRAPGPDEVVELSLSRCLFDDRVVVAPRLGAGLEIASADERRHQVDLAHLGAAGTGEAEVIGVMPLPIIGHRRRVALDRPGVVRATSAVDPAVQAWIIAPPHPYVAETSDSGTATLAEIPAGTYKVRAWHPPLAAGEPPKIAEATVEIKAGETTQLRLPLEGEPWEQDKGTRGGTLPADE